MDETNGLLPKPAAVKKTDSSSISKELLSAEFLPGKAAEIYY